MSYKTLSDEVLVWLPVGNKMQTICIYGLTDGSATPSSRASLNP